MAVQSHWLLETVVAVYTAGAVSSNKSKKPVSTLVMFCRDVSCLSCGTCEVVAHSSVFWRWLRVFVGFVSCSGDYSHGCKLHVTRKCNVLLAILASARSAARSAAAQVDNYSLGS